MGLESGRRLVDFAPMPSHSAGMSLLRDTTLSAAEGPEQSRASIAKAAHKDGFLHPLCEVYCAYSDFGLFFGATRRTYGRG